MLRERYTTSVVRIFMMKLDHLAQVLHCLVIPTHRMIQRMSRLCLMWGMPHANSSRISGTDA
jgi:hypothetical protein